MQPSVFLHTLRLHQFDQPSKSALGVHHLKYRIILAISPIVQEERGNYVKRRIVVFLVVWSVHVRPAMVALLSHVSTYL